MAKQSALFGSRQLKFLCFQRGSIAEAQMEGAHDD